MSRPIYRDNELFTVFLIVLACAVTYVFGFFSGAATDSIEEGPTYTETSPGYWERD